MVFVAAAGGGMKAAAFTAAAIDCLFIGTDTAGDPGSPAAPQHPCVTADALAATLRRKWGVGAAASASRSVLAERAGGPLTDNWISDRLGQDLLSPELAWQLFVEVPNAVANFNPHLDRGEVLQESWRREFEHGSADPGGAAFFTDMSTSTWANPLVFLSGTNLNDGCRVNISAARSANRADPAAETSYPADPPLLDPGATRRGAAARTSESLGRASHRIRR